MMRLAVLCFSLLTILNGCASSATIKPQKIVEKHMQTIAKKHAKNRLFWIRYNPVSCNMPPFEVYLDDQYHRVFLEPDEPEGPVAQLQEQLEQKRLDQDPSQKIQVYGSLSTGVRLSPTRAHCLQIKISEICPPQGCDEDGMNGF